MKIIFLIICLIVVFFTLENFIVSGFNAKSHRLLPLVLGLLALYDFYLIVELMTGQTESFHILKQLLLVQLLDVILYYILDFSKIKLPIWAHCLIVSVLILMDIFIITQIDSPRVYQAHITAFVVLSVAGIIALVFSRAPKNKYISKQMRKNKYILLGALFIPALGLIFTILGIIEKIILPIAINIACIILDYLFFTDRLREVDSVLKEEHFHTLDMPAFIFDSDFFFLDASKKARALFPEQIAEIESSPQEFELQQQLTEMLNNDGILYREIGDRFYRCELQGAYYRGKKKGYILTFTDITEQKMEADMAMEVAKQKSDFLANMSHDLRSPLHAIIGSSEILLSRGEMSSRNNNMVNYIHEAGNNLLDIVNSILEFSKLESGNISLHPQKYNFKNLVEDQARIAFSNLKDKSVLFSIEVMDPFPEYMYGDELRIRQIVQNLISNAVKFTDEGYISCRFNIAIEQENQIGIKFSVEDTGSGMTPKQAEDVFNDYVTYAQEHKKEGTGLGLSIVRKLSEMMGGRAWAESDGKTGTTVYAQFNQGLVEEDILLMEKDGVILAEPFQIKNEKTMDSARFWKNDVQPNYVYPDAKVLIADDMAVNCDIFKELSTPWEIQLDVAKNGQEAVEKASKNTYDLIFLDQMMPVMSGTEAADKLKEIGIETPKILLTANITEDMKESSKRHGFNAFMHKPIDIATLRTNLEKYLPEGLRKPYDSSKENMGRVSVSHDEKYCRTLETYIGEMETLYEVMPSYAKNDIAMFRNKVHGIKGVSRQIGKEQMAVFAETMEMAAILENREFISKNFDIFYGELEYTIESSKQELARIRSRMAKVDDNDGLTEMDNEPASAESIKDLFQQLGKSLEEYELAETDKVIERLNQINLPDGIKEAYERLKEFYDDMEYEDAINELNQMIY